mgnify:FL=1
MKRMLVNATQPEELRVALVDGQSIYDFDLEQLGQERKKSNIYKARVSRIEQSLGAAFVDFGAERHGFLPIKELAPEYLKNKRGKNNISDCLTQGQEIIVQVDKEERGNKGAALSTFISLPGHYLVLMPNNSEAGGVSRSLEGKERDKVRENLKALKRPDNMGVIVRTAAAGASLEELQWDLDYLLNIWDAIQEANQQRKAPFLIYRDDDLISRSLRDFLRDDITEVLIDTDEAFEQAQDFASRLTPEYLERIKRYDESIPLFTRYQIESQIETAYQREVTLQNGGSISIDQTEALVCIDINSAKATGGSDIEETALKTNLEAAKEIAKQLRLRDVGGLLVIDFIDMQSFKNKRAVEDMVNKSIEIDRAKIQVGRISRFGLLEMSRQRLRPSLEERWTQDISSLSTAVLRLIEEESSKKMSGEVRAVVSSDMSVFLLNERRGRINEIEERTDVRVVIVSDPSRADNRFEVTRIKKNEKSKESSYEIQESLNEDTNLGYKVSKQEKAAVSIKPPKKPKKKGKGFIRKIIETLTGEEDNSKNKKETKSKSNQRKRKQTNKPRPNKKPHPRTANQRNKKAENSKDTKKKSNVKKAAQSKGKKEEKKTPTSKAKKPTSQSKKPVKDKTDSNKKPLPKKKEQNKAPDKVEKKDKKTPNKTKDKVEKQNVSLKESKEKEEPIKKVEKKKSGKDWGVASNDPRKK